MASPGEIRLALEGPKRFNIIEEISEGANAVAAFRAFDRVIEREVFLKVIYYSPEAAPELLREPRLLVQATKGNPKPENLVQVFAGEFITIGGETHLCLHMEWISGSSLLSSLKANTVGQLEALRIARGILHGLSHLHALRILHRDLKPANILLDGDTPKISDFGSVAMLPDGATAVTASKHSALYVPPEGWAPEPRYSVVSDLYQVGMVLYELINGPLETDPRHYLTPKVLRDLHASGCDYKSLDLCEKSLQTDKGIAELGSKGLLLSVGRAERPYYSAKLRRIVKKATHPDPMKRYASAAEFISKLNQTDVPNWRQISAGEFFADDWREWDWALSGVRPSVVVRKSRRKANNFRKIANGVFPSLEEAFAYVDGQ